MGRMKDYLYDLQNELDELWMKPIREQQHEYNKPRCLEPNDGSDWRRELI